MSVGLGLLKMVIDEQRSLTSLLTVGIEPEDFVQEERTVFKMVQNHLSQFGEMPKIATVEKETGVTFPEFPDEPMGYWMESVQRRSRLNLMLLHSREVLEAAGDGDLTAAEERMLTLWSKLRSRQQAGQVVQVGQVSGAVTKAHDTRQTRGVLAGIPFGLPYLDVISDGAQPGETVAIVGRPGTGKTYLCLNCANQAYEEGEVPLVVSMEMSPQQCVRRLLALRAHVPASMVRLGRLSFWGRKKLMLEANKLEGLSRDRPFWVFRGSLQSTVEDLVEWVRDLRPTVLYVDGAYMLRSRTMSDKRWERVTYTAEFLKSLAGEFAIPVIETYQFNRRGPGRLSNVAYSDAIPQLASIVMSLSEEGRGRRRGWSGVSYKLVELLKGREGERGRFRLLYDMNRMFIRQESVLEGMEDGLQTLEEESDG
jgi:replicative DNA helicase